MLSNIEIGARISSTREMRGLTLDDVATIVGVAKSTIQRYEKGSISKIKLPVLESVANALSVNPNWLIGNTDDPTPAIRVSAPALTLTADETQLVEDYRSLNPEGQTAARTMMAGLTAQPIYKKHHDPAELLGGGA